MITLDRRTDVTTPARSMLRDWISFLYALQARHRLENLRHQGVERLRDTAPHLLRDIGVDDD
ncbi:hypothetical protein [Jannaschia sp. M317]|uniref:hypothetical protein n=1 Tax=Jannaschia sp. M317 TaxID=2867011 RepID=UPI0021A52BE7|nr:hypothetical protein [Jannaschia sp. M317]UWQ18929.1 hypothetical protein K3551_06510 [Jannaschia sp. M317]